MNQARYRQIDPRVLMRAVADDIESFRALSRIFLSSSPAMFERLQRALAAGGPGEIGLASHALKGNAGLVGAAQLCALLAALESAARGGTAPPPPPALPQLFQQVLDEVRDSLASFDGGADAVDEG